jgi:hypothetical protein
MQKISVARDFTRFPSGRYKRNGETSGEAFRERFLEAPIRNGEKVTVELDGTIGYGSSFLEEAFGGVVRSVRIQPDKLAALMTLVSDDATLLDEINGYIQDAAAALK